MRRRKRSSRRAAICSGGRVRTRAAASSIASGMPSRRRQICATAVRVGVGQREARARPRGRDRRRGAPRRSEPSAATVVRPADLRAGSASTAPARGSRRAMPSGSRLVARTCRPAQRRRSASADVDDGVEQVLAVVEDEQHAAVAERCDDAPPIRRRPRVLRDAERRGDGVGDEGASSTTPRLDEPHAAGERRRPGARRPRGPGGSCRRRRGR